MPKSPGAITRRLIVLTNESRGCKPRDAITAHRSPSRRQPDSDYVTSASVVLYWLPLGAGGRSVRFNGRVFEAVAARHERRPVRDLYHSALKVRLDGDRFVIEMTPAWGNGAVDRGVVRVGPVGVRWLGRFAAFRYEVRRWRGGVIPDVGQAVAGPRQIGGDAGRAWRLLDLVPQVPALMWGRDEMRTGEMWNSNSLTAWLLARSGHEVGTVGPPEHGRAPGWHAGLSVAATQTRVRVTEPHRREQ